MGPREERKRSGTAETSSQLETNQKPDMARYGETLPPFVATVNGVVVERRTTSGIWAGKSLKKLEYAKKGYLSDQNEVFGAERIKEFMHSVHETIGTNGPMGRTRP